MTIAYIRTYSNKQQTESQKNAIEQFAKAKKIEIDKWLKDAKNSSKEKNRLEDVIKIYKKAIFLSSPMSLDSAGN